jgi:peptidylprolyl isomerase
MCAAIVLAGNFFVWNAFGQKVIPADEQKIVELPSGLKYVDLVAGEGPKIVRGQQITVDYEGRLQDSGQLFDSSKQRGKPMTYYHLVTQMIPGWNEGITHMRVGGKRRIIVPPPLGYGNSGSGEIIPPGATLVFEIELLSAGAVLSKP